jgi:glycosyltransferase
MTDETLNPEPQVSVVVVTRNDASRLALTLASLTAQVPGGGTWEVVLADGMSTDATPVVAQQFAARLPQMKVIRQHDDGIYDAMNKAAVVARGRYILFLNCGDALSETTSLASLAGAAAVQQAAWMVFDINHFMGGSTAQRLHTSPFRLPRFIVGKQPYCHQACLFRRDLLLGCGGFDVSYGFMSDYDLIFKFAVVEPPATVAGCLIDYEGGGVSAQRAGEIPALMHRIRRDRLGLDGLTDAASSAFARLQHARRFGALRWVPPRVRSPRISRSRRGRGTTGEGGSVG